MTLAALRAEMTRLAKQLPEYDTLRAMYGVGETTAAQLMAEIDKGWKSAEEGGWLSLEEVESQLGLTDE